MKLVSLYHVGSTHMFYNEEAKEIIRDLAAIEIAKRIGSSEHVGLREYDDADTIPMYEHFIKAYGRIYEV